MAPKLSAVLIALNEEAHISDCLRSLNFCDEKIVVDSGSKDRTVELAEVAGARVYRNRFEDFSSQKNFAIAQSSGDWVLLVDADERISEPLAKEIQKTLQAPKADGYYLLRHNRIFGRWMRFGANALDYQLRLVRREKAVFEGLVHERIRELGRTARLKHPMQHDSTSKISVYMLKLNTYSHLEARTLGLRSNQPSLKQMKWKPLARFFQLMFWKQGFRDGMEGFIFCVLSGYYEFIRYAKQWEAERTTHEG